GGVAGVTGIAGAAGDAAGVGIRGRLECLGDELAGGVDALLDAVLDHRFSGEPAAVTHADVGGEDDGVGRGDHPRVERGRTGGALRLDLQVDAAFGCLLGQCVGGHVGVGDPRGA